MDKKNKKPAAKTKTTPSADNGAKFYDEPMSPEAMKQSWKEEAAQPGFGLAPGQHGQGLPPAPMAMKPGEMANQGPAPEHHDLLSSILAGLAHVGTKVPR